MRARSFSQDCETPARVDELTADNQHLQGELIQALARVAELTDQLSKAQDDLAAARASIRRMIRTENSSP